MFEEGDQEMSESDIGSRDWIKLEKNMKLTGYREGAVQGIDLSLQEGFNLGYADGFKLGESIGMMKAIQSCHSELGFPLNKKPEYSEETLNALSTESCILCSREKTSTSTPHQKSIPDNFENFLSLQQSLINKSIETLEQPNLKYLMKTHDIS